MTVLASTLVKYVSHTILAGLRGDTSLKEVSRFQHYNVEPVIYRVILYSGCVNSAEGGCILAFEDIHEIKLRLVKR